MMEARDPEGKDVSPMIGVIGSQSDKTTENGGVQGYDVGKRSRATSPLTHSTGWSVSWCSPDANIPPVSGAEQYHHLARFTK